MNDEHRVSILKQWENRWNTEMGAWIPGERVLVKGKDQFKEFMDLDFTGLMYFGVTGKIAEPNQARMLTAIFTMMTNYPDPRLWNNRVGTLAGAARSTPCLGAMAGSALSDSIVYGHRPVYAVSLMLADILKKQKDGLSLREILEQRLAKQVAGSSASGKDRQLAKIPGYGRPVANRDERIEPFTALAQELGFGDRPNLNLVFAIERTLKEELNLNWSMNGGALAAALSADQGLSPRQFYYLTAICFSGGVSLCHTDAESHPEGSFFPLSCDKIIYEGAAQREWQVD